MLPAISRSPGRSLRRTCPACERWCRGSPAQSSHREKTRKFRLWQTGGGRSQRSPPTWTATARPSGCLYWGSGRPGSAPACRRIRWPRRRVLAARFADDPHIWARALPGEVVPPGYGLSYASFAGQLRLAGPAPDRQPRRSLRSVPGPPFYLLEDINDPSGKVSMNKPDEKETGDVGTPGCHRPRRQGPRCFCARRASRSRT